MAEVLVLAEHTADGEVEKVTLELLTAVRRLGAPSVVWTGPGADAAAARLGEYGAEKVYVAGGAEFHEYVVAPTAELLAQLVASVMPAMVLIAGTTEGKEVAGRLAVKTGSGVLTDAVNVTADDDGTPMAEQPNFGGAITVHSTVRAPIFEIADYGVVGDLFTVIPGSSTKSPAGTGNR
jgi:electron transfer flavoprotein alpha subunit